MTKRKRGRTKTLEEIDAEFAGPDGSGERIEHDGIGISTGKLKRTLVRATFFLDLQLPLTCRTASRQRQLGA